MPQKSGYIAGFGNAAGTGPGKILKVKNNDDIFYIFCSQELSVPINKTCYIPSEDRRTGPNFFCFGGEKGKGGCVGDSGGAVMVETTGQDDSDR